MFINTLNFFCLLNVSFLEQSRSRICKCLHSGTGSERDRMSWGTGCVGPDVRWLNGFGTNCVAAVKFRAARISQSSIITAKFSAVKLWKAQFLSQQIIGNTKVACFDWVCCAWTFTFKIKTKHFWEDELKFYNILFQISNAVKVISTTFIPRSYFDLTREKHRQL